MEKAFFLNSTNPDYMKYFRSYKRLLLESILILSQGSPTVSSDVDAILDFETKFAKVCILLLSHIYFHPPMNCN